MENPAGNRESLMLFLAATLIHRVEQITNHELCFLPLVPHSIPSYLCPCISLPLLLTPTPTLSHLEGWSYMVTVDTLCFFPFACTVLLFGNRVPNYSLDKSCLLFILGLEPCSEHLWNTAAFVVWPSHGLFWLLPGIASYFFPTCLIYPVALKVAVNILSSSFMFLPQYLSAHRLAWNSINVGWLKCKTLLTQWLPFYIEWLLSTEQC